MARREEIGYNVLIPLKIADAEEKYIGKFLTIKVEEAENEWYNTVIKGKHELIREYENARAFKINNLNASIAEPPSVELSVMLMGLNNRKEISENELKSIAESCKDSYPALRMISDIADKHGYIMNIPTYDEIITTINDLCDYAIERLNSDGNSYDDLLFFGESDMPLFDEPAKELDLNAFTSITEIVEKKRVLTNAENTILDKMVKDSEGDTYEDKIGNLVKNVPDVKEMIKASDYAVYLKND